MGRRRWDDSGLFGETRAAGSQGATSPWGKPLLPPWRLGKFEAPAVPVLPCPSPSKSLLMSQVSSYKSQISASSHLLPPAAAGIGEAAVEAMAGHQDLVTCSPVSAKLRPSQEGQQVCVTAMHGTQQKDLLSLRVPGWRGWRLQGIKYWEEPMGAFANTSSARASGANFSLNRWNHLLPCCRFVVSRAETKV